MNKNKAIFVLILLLTMLFAILALLIFCGAKVIFAAVVGLLALMGTIYLSAILLAWLTDVEAENMAPIEIGKPEDDDQDITKIQQTYDEIKREIEKEIGGDGE